MLQRDCFELGMLRYMKIFSLPKYLFLSLFVSFFLAIIIIDKLHGGFASLQGTFFLSQCIAIVITTLVVVSKPKWRSVSLPWLVATAATFVIMLHSFTTFHDGRRIVTEGDGPAGVGYTCEYGESYTTIVDITGIQKTSFTANNLNANLCWLKEMPLAASNVTPYYPLDYENDGLVLLLIYEAIIGASFFLTRKLSKTYRQTKLASKA